MPNIPAVDLGRILNPRGRQIVYAVFVVTAVVAFVLDLAIENNPEWLDAAQRALDGLFPFVGALALVNVPTGTVVAGEDAVRIDGTFVDEDGDGLDDDTGLGRRGA